MSEQILTEQSNPASTDIDLLSGRQIVELINREDQKVAIAVAAETENIGRAVELIAAAFQKGGRLGYFGAGTSGRLGVLGAAECMPTFSVPDTMVQAFIAGGNAALRPAVENAEDSRKKALADINAFSPLPDDVIVGISASGNPAYVLTVLEEARCRGANTVGITCNPEAKLKPLCDVCITAPVGPEVIAGSSRMKAGTAQKMILNMLSTASMIKIGKTYGNYMIDVTPACAKLIDRGNRIIAAICKISVAKAEEYRIKAGNNVKTACVMCKRQCSREQAEQLLKQHNGILRKVIES